ncbi:MAG: MurR/RpiR family transcriptional regulator [Pelagimonas sp.]|uniref:MurR/RpiR family transcriptional regulator n=1 Tax=Pelagimonas sp. TaxID=2073170 RepID=UPI003D6A7A55
MTSRIEDRIGENYSDLSAKLRDAADYVAANQLAVATRSLRAVSGESGVSPATLSRLARTLGFSDYESLRDLCRTAMETRSTPFAERAELLKQDPQAKATIPDRQFAACIDNISKLAETVDRKRLQSAVDTLQDARQVILLGAFGSTGIVEYMAYLADYFNSNWKLAGRMGASLGPTLSDLGQGDVLLAVTKSPYARRTVQAAELAQGAGAQTIIVTDSHACPANKFADYSFIIPSESPQFFSSYAATLSLLETMVAMLVAQSGDKASQKIKDVERRHQQLGEFWGA